MCYYMKHCYSPFIIFCLAIISFSLFKIVIKYCPAAISKSEITCWSVVNDLTMLPCMSAILSLSEVQGKAPRYGLKGILFACRL